jgi:hypothetical protein
MGRRSATEVYAGPTSPDPSLSATAVPHRPPGRAWPSATLYFRRSRLMFQVFDLDVAKVYLRCCMCYNDNISMLQVYVFSVSGISDVCFKCFICMSQK